MDPLPDDELVRRLKAARELRGIDQNTLGLLFKEDGLGKMDPGRIERGEMKMQRAHRDAFCRHLGLPERWLTEPDIDVIVGLRPPARLTPGDARDLMTQLLADLDRADLQDQQGTRSQQADTGHPPAAEGGAGA